jgi:transposase
MARKDARKPGRVRADRPSHRAIERAFSVSFAKVNPRQTRRLAQATGKLAKADCLVPATLTRMDALLEF